MANQVLNQHNNGPLLRLWKKVSKRKW